MQIVLHMWHIYMVSNLCEFSYALLNIVFEYIVLHMWHICVASPQCESCYGSVNQSYVHVPHICHICTFSS